MKKVAVGSFAVEEEDKEMKAKMMMEKNQVLEEEEDGNQKNNDHELAGGQGDVEIQPKQPLTRIGWTWHG